MKYVIWVLTFVTYLLAIVGILRLLANITSGIEVEMSVVGENGIARMEMVEFNEIPVIKWVFGMLGLFIAVGGGFLLAEYMGRAWTGEEETMMSKSERIVQCVLFTIFFFAFSFIFRIHLIDDVFGLLGWLFMAATSASTILVSAVVNKFLLNKRDAESAVSSEV